MTTFTAAQMTGRPFNSRVEVYGDSRMFYGMLNTSANKQLTTRSFLDWCRFLSNQAFDHDISDIYATAGITSDQVLALMQANPAGAIAGTAIVLCSTNDRNTQNSAWSIGYLQQIQALAIQRGQVMIWLNEMPRGGGNALTATQLKDHLNVIRWINQQASVPGVYVVNSFGALVDVTDAAAAPLANMLADGLHQNGRGCYTIATSLLPLINYLFPARDLRCNTPADAYDATNNPRGVLNANPLMTGTGGTINAPGAGAMSGSLAANYAATLMNGTGLTVTLTANVSSNGKTWQQIGITGTPTSAGAKLTLASIAAITASVSVGDTVDQLMEMEVDTAQTGLNSISLEAGLNAMNRRDMAVYDVTDLYPAVALAGTQRIGPFLLGAEASFFKTQMSVYLLQNVAASFTVRVRGLAARKVS
jgi:hypothetical protein